MRSGRWELRFYQCRSRALPLSCAWGLCPELWKLRARSIKCISDAIGASLFSRLDVQCLIYVFRSKIDGTRHRQFQSRRYYLQSVSAGQRLWDRRLCFPASRCCLRHLRFAPRQGPSVWFIDVQVGGCDRGWLADHL